MSEAAKAARAAMKNKAKRLTNGEPRTKVDASSWTPPEMLNTTAKTGLRPVSRRAYKKGGKVVAMEGEYCPPRADRKPRKAGGEATSYANAKITRNVKEANAEAFGRPHIGGMKKGGRAKKMGGGAMNPRAMAAARMEEASQRAGVPTGRMGFVRKATSPLPMSGMKKGGMASDDMSQDKKLIKKAFRQHEVAEHGGKHSELKLRKGGMAKAAGGDVDDMGAGSGKRTDKTENVYRPKYNEESVDKAIASSRQKIGRKESAAIKALLKGRYAAGGSTIERLLTRARDDKKPKRYVGKNRAPMDVGFDAVDEQMINAQREAVMKKMYEANQARKRAEADSRDADLRRAKMMSADSPFKKGGRAKKEEGGPAMTPPMSDEERAKISQQAIINEMRGIAADRAESAESRADAMRRLKELMQTRKNGGKIEPNYEGGTRPTGGRLARKAGGRAKGKTNINIIISPGAKDGAQAALLPPSARPPAMAVAVPPPPGAPGAPPGAAPMPMPMPMPMPPGAGAGAPPPGMPPMMGRKAGGRVGHRTYSSFKDMDAGSGGALGRLEKTEIAEKKMPRKEGGRVGHRVYKSYKDMDAGSLGGMGKLEKTEIAARKR